MNKTISITIARLIFHVEEPAYGRIDSYLSSVKRHFSAYEDSEEIIRDIETRIAEEFLKRTDQGKKVITSSDVDEVIKQIGTVEDFEHFEGEPKKTPASTASRRLYRDRDNSILGGVAAGIAAYFGVDVTLVRVLFVVFALAWGTSILIYLILWLVMPEAKTTAQKLQMSGEPLTLAGLEEKIKSKVPPQEEVRSGVGKFARSLASITRQVGEGLLTFIKAIGPVLIAIVGICLVIGSVLAIAFTTVVFVSLVTGTHAVYLDFPLAQFVGGSPGYSILLAAVYALVLIPIVFVMLAGLALARMKKPVSTPAAVILLGTWVVALVIAGIVGLQEGPAYKVKYDEYIANLEQNEKLFELSEFQAAEIGGAYEISIIPSDVYFVKAYGDQRALDRLNVRVDGEELKVTNTYNERLCIFCFHRSARLEIGMPSPAQLDLSGATKTVINGYTLERLEVELSGAARLESDSSVIDLKLKQSGASKGVFTGSITSADADLSGASKLDIAQTMESLRLKASGASKAEVGNVQAVIADLSGASSLHYSGVPDELNVRTSGAGKAVSE